MGIAWCEDDKAFYPLFETTAHEHVSDALRIRSHQRRRQPTVSAKLIVMSIPTVVLIDAHGAEQDRIIGMPSRVRLEQMIALAEFGPQDAA